MLEGDAVIVATEAWAATRLMRDVDEEIADLLASIPCSSSATVPMAFRAEDCPFDTKWFGILSPLVEQRPLLAVTLSSSKWPDRAPENRVLLRGFIGGPANQHLLETTDEDAHRDGPAQLVDLLGMKPDAQPVYASVYRWVGGMPQYTLGHLDRVDEIERRTREIAGIELAGGAFRGVGIPNCIESGERAVTKVLGDLGITYDEDTHAAGAARTRAWRRPRRPRDRLKQHRVERGVRGDDVARRDVQGAAVEVGDRARRTPRRSARRRPCPTAGARSPRSRPCGRWPRCTDRPLPSRRAARRARVAPALRASAAGGSNGAPRS